MEYEDRVDFTIINYNKAKDSIANLSIDVEKKGDNLKIKKFDFIEGKKFIKLNNVSFLKK